VGSFVIVLLAAADVSVSLAVAPGTACVSREGLGARLERAGLVVMPERSSTLHVELTREGSFIRVRGVRRGTPLERKVAAGVDECAAVERVIAALIHSWAQAVPSMKPETIARGASDGGTPPISSAIEETSRSTSGERAGGAAVRATTDLGSASFDGGFLAATSRESMPSMASTLARGVLDAGLHKDGASAALPRAGDDAGLAAAVTDGANDAGNAGASNVSIALGRVIIDAGTTGQASASIALGRVIIDAGTTGQASASIAPGATTDRLLEAAGSEPSSATRTSTDRRSEPPGALTSGTSISLTPAVAVRAARATGDAGVETSSADRLALDLSLLGGGAIGPTSSVTGAGQLAAALSLSRFGGALDLGLESQRTGTVMPASVETTAQWASLSGFIQGAPLERLRLRFGAGVRGWRFAASSSGVLDAQTTQVFSFGGVVWADASFRLVGPLSVQASLVGAARWRPQHFLVTGLGAVLELGPYSALALIGVSIRGLGE